MHLSSILLSIVGMAFAAPQGTPYALYVPGMAPGSAVNDHQGSPAGLPGYDHLMRNKTPNVIGSSFNQPKFDGKCTQVTLGGHGKVGQAMLEGRCVDDAGQWWQTSLNLNECIGNDAGKLVYHENGNFDNSCRPCTFDKVPGGSDLVLKCNCLDGNKIPKFTYLEMGPDVQNDLAVKPVDGRFVCGSTIGIRSPSL